MVEFKKISLRGLLNLLWAPSFDKEYEDYMTKSNNQLLKEYVTAKSVNHASSTMLPFLIFIFSFMGGSVLLILSQAGTLLQEIDLFKGGLDVIYWLVVPFVVLWFILWRVIYRSSYSAELIKYVLEQREGKEK